MTFPGYQAGIYPGNVMDYPVAAGIEGACRLLEWT